MRSKWKAMLVTTMQVSGIRNERRYTKDDRRRKDLGRQSRGGLFTTILLVVLMYIGGTTIMSRPGMAMAVPAMAVQVATVLTFFLGFLRTNGALFGIKDYSLLQAMPLSNRIIVFSKLSVIYIQMLVLSLAATLPFGLAFVTRYPSAGFLTFVLWLLMSAFVPLIPLSAATLVGCLVVRFTKGSRHKKGLQAIGEIIVSIGIFAIYMLFINGRSRAAMAADGALKIMKYYPPSKWFSDVIMNGSLTGLCLLLGVSLVVTVISIFIVGKVYVSVNSNEGSVSYSRKKSASVSKVSGHGQFSALLIKERREMLGHPSMMSTIGVMMVLSIGLAIVINVMGVKVIFDGENTGFTMTTLVALLPYYIIGCGPSTVASYSLERKQFWLIRSLPVDKSSYFMSKAAFQLIYMIPVQLITEIILMVSLPVTIPQIILLFIQGVILNLNSAMYGLYCGLKNPNLTWENDSDAVKRGAANRKYMMTHIVSVLVMCFVVGGLSMVMNQTLLIWLVGVGAAIIAAINYMKLQKLVRSM